MVGLSGNFCICAGKKKITWTPMITCIHVLHMNSEHLQRDRINRCLLSQEIGIQSDQKLMLCAKDSTSSLQI